jgi:glycosyltransferase involved in cell wall biosynthesis
MPTAVLEVELTTIPDRIMDLERYGHAEILFRCHGAPLGVARVPIVAGFLERDELAIATLQLSVDAIKAHWIEAHVYEPAARALDLSAVTIAICTRDRTEDLKKCLTAVLRMPANGQEVLVVDNSPSTTSTRHLVEALDRVKYICEDVPGLDVARNRALREAQGEIVAFLDDDAVPDAGWLAAITSNFDDPYVMCCTGLTLPLELETEAQEWFEKYTAFGRGVKRKEWDAAFQNPLGVGSVGAGVNMALRKDVLRHVGPFEEALDAGTPTRSGGDHEYFARILTRGFKIVYEPQAIVRHKHRYTWPELHAAVRGYGTGVYAFWTRSLMKDREFTLPYMALDWLCRTQVPAMIRSVREGESKMLGLQIQELIGCAQGPLAYLKSRRMLKRLSQSR